jgi:hypothetical protein
LSFSPPGLLTLSIWHASSRPAEHDVRIPDEKPCRMKASTTHKELIWTTSTNPIHQNASSGRGACVGGRG